MSNYDDDGFKLASLGVRDINNKRLLNYRAWYYEDRHGLTFVTTTGEQFLIPRNQILRYADVARKWILSQGNKDSD